MTARLVDALPALWLIACAVLVVVLHVLERRRRRGRAWLCPVCGAIYLRPTPARTMAHLVTHNERSHR